MSLIPKLLIDTDAGIDDAGAILIALQAHKDGRAEVLGITTVAGNTSCQDVVRNVCRVMGVAGCKVPLYFGAVDGLAVSYDEYRRGREGFHGRDGFNDVAFESDPDVGDFVEPKVRAADAIRNIINEHPGEVTLVPLGPLTNVALAFGTEPELPAKLKELVIMGGAWEARGNVTPSAEFNFHADPEAARVVVERFAGLCGATYVVPWETCHENLISQDWRWNVLGKLGTPAMELMNKLELPWRERGAFSSMCDQKTMAVALDRGAVVTKEARYHATVELGGSLTRGMLVVTRKLPRRVMPAENVTIVEDLDVEAFKRVLLDSLGKH